MSESDLRGVFCAAVTPFDHSARPDANRLVRHCEQLLQDGCDGVALLGTTGEANSLSTRERMALLDGVRAGGISGDRLMPGTGVPSVTETVELTRHAVEAGVRAVVVLPPFYYKNPAEEGLFDFYARVIEGVGDDRLRLVLYHIPQMTMVPITPALIERLLAKFPNIIAGVKDSAGDLAHMQALAAQFPALAIFAGADPLMLPLLRAGGAGCITATSNVVAKELRHVFDHATGSDDPALDAAVSRVNQLRDLSNRYPQIAAIRAMIAHRYHDDAWLVPKPPLRPLAEHERAAMMLTDHF